MLLLQKPAHQPTKSQSKSCGKNIEDFETDVQFNNQYVKKPGFAYYRDLAGKIYYSIWY